MIERFQAKSHCLWPFLQMTDNLKQRSKSPVETAYIELSLISWALQKGMQSCRKHDKHFRTLPLTELLEFVISHSTTTNTIILTFAYSVVHTYINNAVRAKTHRFTIFIVLEFQHNNINFDLQDACQLHNTDNVQQSPKNCKRICASAQASCTFILYCFVISSAKVIKTRLI